MEVASIPYKSKQREKQRQVRLLKETEVGSRGEEVAESARHPRPVKSVPWSNKIDAKARKEKRQARKAFLKGQRGDGGDGGGDGGDSDADFDELEKDARLLKKLKRGKISKADFDAAVLGDEL